MNRSWLFRTMGHGHDLNTWKQIVSTLRLCGFDGTLAIEHEDSLMSVKGEAGESGRVPEGDHYPKRTHQDVVGLITEGESSMKYGYNLFSAWEITKDRDSLIATMKALKEMGYDGVEFFLYLGIPAEELKEIVDEIGIKPFSTHLRLIRFFESLDEEIAYAKAAGIETLVMPHVADEDRNPEFYQKVLAAIPQWKKKCDEAGVRLAWHNHDFEFQLYDDKRYLMDAIMESAPVEYEIDTFWTTYAGVDTQALMEQYKDRIKYVHFKDYTGAKGTAHTDIGFCAVGEGLVDVKAVAGKAQEIGVEWAVVEQDLHTKDILEDARASLMTLKKLFEG